MRRRPSGSRGRPARRRRVEAEGPPGRPRTCDGPQRHVRAAGDRDAVLTGGVDQDQRDAGRLRRRASTRPRRSIAFGARARRGASSPNESSPIAPTNGGRGAETSRRHRLVAALAAVMAREPATDDGLAGTGQPLDRDDQVDVDRADDDDATTSAGRRRRLTSR